MSLPINRGADKVLCIYNIALNPETGAEIWKYDPGVDGTVKRGEFANRGVAYWRSAAAGMAGNICERRIFVATVDARLIALDAVSGTPCADFGRAGQVDLSREANLGEYQVDSREYGSHVATGDHWRPRYRRLGNW